MEDGLVISNYQESGILEQTNYLDPRYNHLERYVYMMYKGFWTPAKYEKLIKELDVPHFNNKLSEVDQECIRRCILSVLMIEDKVKVFWPTIYKDVPQTIVGDVGGLFGQSEVTHRRSYHSLGEELKVSTNDIEKHPILADRLKYLNKHLEKDPRVTGKRQILKKIILFSALVEKGGLFTSFYLLMSWDKHKKGLPTISALQQSTAAEENCHYSFGIELVDIIKKEYPQLWNDYLVELVSKNIQMAYETELNLIDWFFEKGVPEHLTKEEVVNFLNYNFTTICRDLKLDVKFDYDEDLYREKNEWMTVKIHQSDPDFFAMTPGGYSSEEEEVDLDKFEF